MDKKSKTIKEDDLILGNDDLYYAKDAESPFTGIAEDFYKNGKLKRVQTFKKGKLRGPYIAFYKNGQKKLEATYKYKNSVLDGPITLYHENGVKFQEANLEREIISGFFLEQDDNENLIKYREYSFGAFQGYYNEEEELVKNSDWYKVGRVSNAEGYYDDRAEILVALPQLSEDERKVVDMINKLWW